MYGWVQTGGGSAPTVVTSSMSFGLALSVDTTDGLSHNFRQTFSVPSALVGVPMTFSALVNVTGTGPFTNNPQLMAYVLATGCNLASTYPYYQSALPNSGPQLLSVSFIPQVSGTLTVTINVDGTHSPAFIAQIDECYLGVGTESPINPAKFASLDIAGVTVIVSDTKPTTGTWKVGDECRKQTTVAAGSPGWCCTTAGTGTAAKWSPMAALGAEES